MVEANNDILDDKFEITFITRLMEVLNLPPCDDIVQSREMIRQAFKDNKNLD